ncbi:MAG: tetratricopeptide repeat protein, partial [Nannocystaceae bacterium]|nr:tetratricopeptide repeat protein [Nannocystaceae bacterium]
AASDGAYSVREVARLFGVPERRLRYWSQTGFVSPTVRRGGRVLYGFRDLIAVKVAKGLLDGGVPLRRVRRQLAALRSSLPDVDEPLTDLRIRCEHDRVLVDDPSDPDGGRFEASTGQLVLDLDTRTLQREAAEVLALPWVDANGEMAAGRAGAGPRTAYDWFLEGCELEADWGGSPADTADFAAAKDAYETALDLDPALAAAWTNLGSMLAEVGDLDGSLKHYQEALLHDPEQPEAHCNLAELTLRRGDTEGAIAGYRHLLLNHPEHFEAHYGLARALMRVGGRGQALAHLRRFSAAVDALPDELRGVELQARRDAAAEVMVDLRAELDT